jgi:hypothetical protein
VIERDPRRAIAPRTNPVGRRSEKADELVFVPSSSLNEEGAK